MINWIKSFFCDHEYIPHYFGISVIGYTCMHCMKREYDKKPCKQRGPQSNEYLTDLPFEKRRALIETAVFCFSGKYPEAKDIQHGKGCMASFYLNLNGDLYLVDFHHRPNVWRGRVCTPEEFNKVGMQVKEKYGFSHPTVGGK